MKKHLLLLSVCFLLFFFLFTGCGEESPQLTAENYPSVAGSAVTSILMRNTKASILQADAPSLTSGISCLANDDAYRALAAGEVSLILTTEEPSAELNASLREAGDSYSITQIAVDALVFYTPQSNPVKSLTRRNLTDIFSGTVTDWRSLSGNHISVVPHLLSEDNFYHGLLKGLILSGSEPSDLSSSFSLLPDQDPLTLSLGGEQTMSSNTDLLEEGSISYGSFFYLAPGSQSLGIRFLAIDGVEPSTQTLSDGKYPFTYPIYAVIRNSEVSSSPVRLLIDFWISKDGQKIIKEAGYGTLS